MIKYKRGWQRRLAAATSLGQQYASMSWGALRRWPIFRPPVDHSVYAFDNAQLPSTFTPFARLVHRASWHGPVDCRAVIEFEHPFALLGHIDARSDYAHFQQSLAARLQRFFAWFDPRRHHLIGTSQGAVQQACALAQAHGYSIAPSAVTALPWAGMPRRSALPPVTGPLRVFHYGGEHPASKGTHDVLAVAARLPQVRFDISVQRDHALLPPVALPNVRILPFENKTAYNRAINHAHVLLNPIYGDGWGVILDALQRAMPIITYDSYDKRECVDDGVSGQLIALPAHLSLYDGFATRPTANWQAYNHYIIDHVSHERVDALTHAVSQYADDYNLLQRHSMQAAQLYKLRHFGPHRVARILHIYQRLLDV